MTAPLLHVDAVAKRYTRGAFRREVTFSLEADFVVEAPPIVGVLGPNGSGKTTLFELITGSNLPIGGPVRVDGHDIHRVRYRERDRLAIHYHQSYQVRAFKRTQARRSCSSARAAPRRWCTCSTSRNSTRRTATSDSCWIFSAGCAPTDRLVFLCLHPNEPWHLDILRESCERFIFVDRGRLSHAEDFAGLVRHPPVAAYLGPLASAE